MMKAVAILAFTAAAIAPDALAQSGPSSRRFPTGETVSLAFEPAGIGGTGTITRRVKGQPAKRVTIGYMQEFVAIVTPSRVRYNVAGTTDQGQQSWTCEATIDWKTAKIVFSRSLTQGSHPSC